MSAQVTHEGQRVGSVNITFDLGIAEAGSRKESAEAVIAGLLQIILCAIVVFVFLRLRIVNRISTLSIQSKRFAAGQLDQPIPSHPGDEIDNLACVMESARVSINELIMKQNLQNEILKNLNDSLASKVEEKTMQIVNSEKMASLGEMASGMAHEINNPLAIILGLCDQTLHRLEVDREAQDQNIKSLEKIANMAQRIAKTVKGLKTFSRSGDKDSFVETKFSEILTDTLELCSERFKKGGIELILGDFGNDSLPCRAVQISQVILNLLNNSYDAVQALAEKWVKIDVVNTGSSIQIQITDSGTGIPPQIVDKLMQPFFTTKEVGKGTGLGLSISKGIAEDHGGRLFVDSTCKNTRFIFELKKAVTDKKDQVS